MSKFNLRIGIHFHLLYECREAFTKVYTDKYLTIPSYDSEQAKDSLMKL